MAVRRHDVGGAIDAVSAYGRKPDGKMDMRMPQTIVVYKGGRLECSEAIVRSVAPTSTSPFQVPPTQRTNHYRLAKSLSYIRPTGIGRANQ